MPFTFSDVIMTAKELRDSFLNHYLLVSPLPTKKVAREKRWLFFEVEDSCYECGHRRYRLQWPWVTIYDDVPISLTEQWLVGQTPEWLETDWGAFDIKDMVYHGLPPV